MDTNPAEQNDIANEHDNRVTDLASQLHEEWRQTRLDAATGQYEPRVKVEIATVDGNRKWVNDGADLPEGATEVSRQDIANTKYEELAPEWQAENKAAADVAVTAVEQAKNSGVVELDSNEFLEKASSVVHTKWLERNGDYAPPEQKLPYAELSEEEKEKDRVQVRSAINIVKGQV